MSRGPFLFLTIQAVVLCLASTSHTVRLVQQPRIDRDNTTIKATVVAYDLGVEQANGSCRQTVIARCEQCGKRNEADRYFIIRHQSSCPQLIPEQTLKVERHRSFQLKPDTKCNQTLEELRYFITLSPTGSVTKTPRLKTVRDWEEIQVPPTKKLPCYILTSNVAFQR
jgi:hypothetical protein